MRKLLLFTLVCMLSLHSFSQIKLKVGDKVPDLTITNYLKNTPTDKNFKNKYILLEFWATWCTECLAEVPKLNKIQERFKDKKDFIFISITDESPEKTKKTLEKLKFNSIVVSDQTKKALNDFVVDNEYGNYSIPKTFLIDNQGILQWVGEPWLLNDVVLNKFLEGKQISLSDNTPSNRPSMPTFK